jgi:putative tryptophan/tyrosine transport system substrate-binding protein
MRRRALIALLGGAALACPLPLRAQKAMPVIGFLGTGPGDPFPAVGRAFLTGLEETGYVAGRNVTIEYRWAASRNDRLPALVADLVGRKVDLIATEGGNAPVHAAKNATSEIPIVFTAADPVGAGLVASLARPGGNLTGISNFTLELTPKRLELLSELVPQAKVIGLLVNPATTSSAALIEAVQGAAAIKGLQLAVVNAENENEIDAAFASLVRGQAGGLVAAPDAMFSHRRDQLAALTSRHALPSTYHQRGLVEAGGLMSYSADFPAMYRQAGIYAGRILKGERPADLPVQQPTQFALVINLKTAKALGITVPPSLLARVDEVIE